MTRATHKRRLSTEDGDIGEARSTSNFKRLKTTDSAGSSNDLTEDEIYQLGEEIPKSPQKYNSLAVLLSYGRGSDSLATAALVALCRALCLLWVDGRFARSKTTNGNERAVRNWLKKGSDTFEDLLRRRITSNQPQRQRQAITLYMQLVKAQLESESTSWVKAWTGKGYFRNLTSTLCHVKHSQSICIFAKEYVNKFDDIKYYTFTILSTLLGQQDALEPDRDQILDNIIALFESLEPPATDSKLTTYFHDYSAEQIQFQSPPSKISDRRKQAQLVLQRFLATPIKPQQRKAVLRILTPSILPWLQTPSYALDFLTDSFDAKGSIPLLALSGLYELIAKHNLDYPSFYSKLYSLLDHNVLHSSHRSRFFCLLNALLASSHLPAAMIASFIKRLSRLALHGPPAAVVAVVPWAYNMLKTHPTCTFMIHREPRCTEEREVLELEGAEDPFDMEQSDPMATRAINSCLWELETLRNHFHPNVASLAKIMGQEFRRQSYNLEDFLDHSYRSLVAGELGKEMRRAPVIEFQIPKRIFTTADGDTDLANLMTNMIA